MRFSLQVQKEAGWDQGATPGQPLLQQDATPSDCDGKPLDNDARTLLAERLRPLRADLLPWYSPTLMQVLQNTTDARLMGLSAMNSAAMGVAFARGEAMQELLRGLAGKELALVVDLAGPESVAFAAALAAHCHVVPTFDNWPHPLGVVPAHLTLAALLYHGPKLYRDRGTDERPVLFALDRNRLAAYRNEPNRFDNRYRVRLPDVAAMQKLGIRRVLYLVPAGVPHEELDDLNELFVAWRQHGIELRMIDLGDFKPATAPAAATPATSSTRTPYYYHGSPTSHFWFWHHIPWYSPPAAVRATDPGVPLTGRNYTPNTRSTQFSPGLPHIGLTPDPTRRSTPSGSGGSWGRSSGRSSFSG
ncbi:MAG: hypothetical protein IPK26_11825 [Planctomycetes bacterium]|nr:hypothetical protein [Planctomycetota bacterium]